MHSERVNPRAINGNPEASKDHVPGGDTALRVSVPCPVCGTQGDLVLKERLPDYDIVRCRRCCVLFVGTPIDTAEFYRETDYPQAEVYEEHADSLYREARQTLRFAQRSVGHLTDKRLLDVGCGMGHLLAEAQRLGADVTGVDVNKQAIAVAERSIGEGRVIHGTLESAALPDSHFDIVTANNLIEHLTQPAQFVSEVRRVLRPAGVLVIMTPDERALFHSVLRLAHRVTRGRFTFSGMTPWGHVVLFSPATLSRLLKARGFRLVAFTSTMSGLRELFARVRLHASRSNRLRAALWNTAAALVFPPIWALSVITGRKNRFVAVARRET